MISPEPHHLPDPGEQFGDYRERGGMGAVYEAEQIETGDVDDTPVIIMELVRGCTLQERVERGGPMATSEAVNAIIDVISVLQAAQAIGILHRDIKPANCFEDVDGAVNVGDFLAVPRFCCRPGEGRSR